MARAKGRRHRSTDQIAAAGRLHIGNQLLALLPAVAREGVVLGAQKIKLRRGEIVFEPRDNIVYSYFPLDETIISFVLPMQDGHDVELTSIGREGAVGGIISLGHKPAFSRALVRIPGAALRISTTRLNDIGRSTLKAHDVLARYGDCLLAQMQQSVGCAMIHPLDQRCSRWLLTAHDRLRESDIPLTQEMLGEMFGVGRTYLTHIARVLKDRGAISYHRGNMRVENRRLLEKLSCECYRAVREHFERVLPGLYPSRR
jgi:CRP-like cAMP-binding protein